MYVLVSKKFEKLKTIKLDDINNPMGLNMFNLRLRRNHLKGWPPSDMYVSKANMLILIPCWLNESWGRGRESEKKRKIQEKYSNQFLNDVCRF